VAPLAQHGVKGYETIILSWLLSKSWRGVGRDPPCANAVKAEIRCTFWAERFADAASSPTSPGSTATSASAIVPGDAATQRGPGNCPIPGRSGPAMVELATAGSLDQRGAWGAEDGTRPCRNGILPARI